MFNLYQGALSHMRQLSRVIKNAVLTGCCTFGGFGVVKSYGQVQDKSQNLDSLYQYKTRLLADQYSFLDEKTVDYTVAMMFDKLATPQDEKRPSRRIAYLAQEKKSVASSAYRRVSIEYFGDDGPSLVGFDAETASEDAREKGYKWVTAPAGHVHYVYDLAMLDSLVAVQNEYNRTRDVDVSLKVGSVRGSQAVALMDHDWSGGSASPGSIIIYADLMAKLDLPEVEAVQCHEMGHFEYAMLGSQEDKDYEITGILNKIGYNEDVIHMLCPAGEEVYADIFSMKMLVDKYGDKALGHMQQALVKTAMMRTGYSISALDNSKKDNKTHDVKSIVLDRFIFEAAMLSGRPYEVHPPLPVRMDVAEKAFHYYMKK